MLAVGWVMAAASFLVGEPAAVWLTAGALTLGLLGLWLVFGRG